MAGSGKTGADFVLVAALAVGQSREEAGRQAGVSLRTVNRRMQDAEFRRAVDLAKSEAVSRATALLGALAVGAVTVLGQLLKAESEHVRLAAAVKVLEIGGRLREAQDFEARLSALEERLAESPQPLRRIR